MTGLNLESLLRLLRADLGAWVTLGLIVVVLGLMGWTSWGSRRALRKCLVLSVVAHVGLAFYGGTVPVVLRGDRREPPEAPGRERLRRITVIPPAGDPAKPGGRAGTAEGGVGLAPWDRPAGGLALADLKLSAVKTAAAPEAEARPGDRPALPAGVATPDAPAPDPADPERRAAVPPGDATPAGPDAGPSEEVPLAIIAARPDVGPEPPAPAPRATPRLRPGRDPAPAAPPPAPADRTLLPLPLPLAAPAPPEPEAREATPEPSSATTTEAAGAEPTPAARAAPEARDVAPAEVAPARPEAPRLSLGDAPLRTRARPAEGGADAPAPRPSLGPILTGAAPPPSAVAPGADSDPGTAGPGPALAAADEGVAAEPRLPAVSGDEAAAATVVKRPSDPDQIPAPPEGDVRRRARPSPTTTPVAGRRPAPVGPLALAGVSPSPIPPAPAESPTPFTARPLSDVPEVYRTRLDPNRSARAIRSGASPASEQAVERALNWLARHQDDDGRWDGATARFDDGTPLKGDDDFTVHCPAGEPCAGECAYWEADTALTGLALLAYLGAGYTQAEGKYAATVARGLDFLVRGQRRDGDLRGMSKAIGMYCHAMATVALCEAYALTGDARLRDPVERAVGFLVRARSRDGLAWRYAPGAADSDTSILGWAVLALKSGREVGIRLPENLPAGVLKWLDKVASGPFRGLASYQPGTAVTPTMTAEAWVCRQFLGAGGPGPAGAESAGYLLDHGPRSDPYNLYYWYYGTLAMYQHGGEPWERWNSQVRDELVRRQRPSGHALGSYDPDETRYGSKGGRVYATALATLSLEVYYRYLRLYDDPQVPPAVAPAPDPDRTRGRLGDARPPR